MNAFSHFILFTALLILTSCAPRFILRPMGDQILERDSREYSYAESNECRLEATYLDEKLDSTLIEFKLTSKQKKSMNLSYEKLRLEGAPFPEQRIAAEEPGIHRRRIEEEVQLIQKRLTASTWDGVDAIHDFFVTESKDETIEKSKDAFADNKKEREKLEKRSALLKKELDFLGDRGFRETSIESKGSFTGIAIFPNRYEKEGDATFLVDAPGCKIQVPFAARVSKSSLF